MAGIGDFANWLSLRGPRGAAQADDLTIPPGHGPLVLICGHAAGLAQALRRGRKGVRLGALGLIGDDSVVQALAVPPADPAAARLLIERLSPGALLLADGALPAALAAVCDDADIPVTLIADRHQLAAAAARTAWRGLRRGPLARLSRVLVPDRAGKDAALRAGIAPARIETVGAAAPVLPPLPCNPREHATMRTMLANRHVWLAAALSAIEAPAVIAAQRAVLAVHHRALLIAAADRPEDAPAIVAAAEAAGLCVARRDADEEPEDDVQVLITEDSAELGLWYRLAPVAFMGGTLIQSDRVPRHPFEPAGLGAAILHGPHLPTHADLWQALDSAGGARQVRNAVQLGMVVEELGSPDLAARLALAAWQQATAGAEVSQRVAEAVLSDLPDSAS